MIRFGILGTASIARAFFGTALVNAEIVAIASRERARADKFAEEFNIPRRYGSYEELLKDDGIDAVYIPLPHFLHCEYVIRAAAAGKHVLVEKPAGLDVREVVRMKEACGGHHVLFMEGLMYRFKSIHQRVQQLLHSGALGTVRAIDFSWCFPISKLRRGLFRVESAGRGGALRDIGIYGIDFMRLITGREPELAGAYVHRDTPDGADMLSHAVLRFGDIVATLTAGYSCDANYYVISGDLGSIHVPASVAGRYMQNTIMMHIVENDRKVEEIFAPENAYALELDYFARCIERNEEPVAGAENAIRNIAVVEQILETGVRI